jgi:hypothetical protein
MSDQFTAAELAGMRTAQDGHMLDTCVRSVYSRTFNSFGEPVEVYTDAVTSLACGLDMRPGAERHGQDMTTLEYDATMRLPIATTLDVKDRLKVTHRFGEAITNLIFRIEGPIQRGPSGIRVLLRRVDV